MCLEGRSAGLLPVVVQEPLVPQPDAAETAWAVASDTGTEDPLPLLQLLSGLFAICDPASGYCDRPDIGSGWEGAEGI